MAGERKGILGAVIVAAEDERVIEWGCQDRQRIAVLVISEQELALVIGAPQLIGALA
jgi:hypothetical protein